MLLLAHAPGEASEPGDVLIVTGKQEARSAPVSINQAMIEAIRPRTFDELARALPGTSLSTNSRGESIATLRGRSERDAAILFDGVPINDPWDQRVELQLIPINLLDGVDVEPVGAVRSASGSTIEIQSTDEISSSFDAEAGSVNYGLIRGTSGLKSNDTEVLASLQAFRRDAVPLSEDNHLRFSQRDPHRRTNTDREQVSGALILRGETKAWTGQAFLLASHAEHGVAPEGHLDPAVSRVRFWRILEDRKIIAAASSKWSAPGLTVGLDGWHHRSRRRIESYTDDRYDTLDDEERGDTEETGAAIAAHRLTDRYSLSAGTRVQVSNHDVITDTDRETFRRRTSSFWADARIPLNKASGLAGGIRREGFRTLASGGRERGTDLAVWTAQARFHHQLDKHWRITAASARLARLP